MTEKYLTSECEMLQVAVKERKILGARLPSRQR